MADRPFARVYYRDLKRDYADIYFDPTALSTYIRLLVECEIAYPSDPSLPAAMRRADLALLERRTLLIRVNGHQYTIKGYRDERDQRSDHARKGRGGG